MLVLNLRVATWFCIRILVKLAFVVLAVETKVWGHAHRWDTVSQGTSACMGPCQPVLTGGSAALGTALPACVFLFMLMSQAVCWRAVLHIPSFTKRV